MAAVLSEVFRHIAGMSWKIAWGLVLGFAISAFVQATVSGRRIGRHLGRADVRSLVLATGFGAASSSCSYAAAAMSRTLFGKGAHVINATAFLIASTNLVIEIGLVIWVMLGPRFVLAEIAGGLILIATVAALLALVTPRRIIDQAREHLKQSGPDRGPESETLPLSRLLSLEGLSVAGRYFAADWRMIGKDIAIGVTVAGTLAALVPEGWWRAIFLSTGEMGGPPGFWSSLENILVGPLIAVLSFVCSVGNIPLAAVLWSGGIGFGGLIAFIFADLITLPMILVYRRYFGWKPAGYYALTLYAAIVISAFVVEVLFWLTGLTPSRQSRVSLADRAYFAWDYTTFLNLFFLSIGAVLFRLGSRGNRHGGGPHG